MSETVKKPPIGVPPRWEWERHRAEQIINAMRRYLEARQPIPREWFAELEQIAGEP